MFESSLQTALVSDATLITYVSSFTIAGGTAPSIFSEFAPETAELPYITYKIRATSPDDNLAVRSFSIFIDYFDYNNSASNSRKAAERIEFLLDREVLEHERYNKIRLYYYNGYTIDEADPRSIHYVLQFNVRAGRKKWIDTVTA